MRFLQGWEYRTSRLDFDLKLRQPSRPRYSNHLIATFSGFDILLHVVQAPHFVFPQHNYEEIANATKHARNPTLNFLQRETELDIWDRGGDTLAADWYGGPRDCPPLPTTSDPQYTYSGSGNVYTNYCDSNNTSTGNKFGDDDTGFQHVMTSLQTTLPVYRPGAQMDMFLIMDHNAWTWDCAKGTYGTFQYNGVNEPWCAAGKMINDLEYLYNTYYKPNSQISSTYTAPGGLPIIAFFQSEANDFSQCGTSLPSCVYNSVSGQEQKCNSSTVCFQAVYAQVRSEADSLFGTNNYYFIFVGSSGCPIMGGGGHPYSDGCYAWPNPWVAGSSGSITNQTQQYNYCTGTWVNGSCSTATGGTEVALDNFYYNSVHTICKANEGLLNGCTGYGGHQLLLMGGAFKGFDDLMTNSPNAPGWYAARVATQGCGTTWVNSWGEMTEMSNWYSQANNPLPWMMVATWDDYEEGSEIETGIDNCIETSTFAPTITSNTLKWSFQFDDTTRDPNHLANINTIDHYDFYYTTDGTNYYLVDHDITPSQANCAFNYPDVACSGINIASYGLPSGSTVFVEAIGKPGITNWLSQGVPYP